MRHAWPAVVVVVLVGMLAGCAQNTQSSAADGKQTVRIGYFPNVTHAPALVAAARGEFLKAVGPKVTVEMQAFNAGPEAMEALLAGAIDISYVGPNPAINTYVKSNGSALRIIAGACTGGASLVARADARIARIEDLSGKRLAVPQLGGTQDISARRFLSEKGLKPLDKGGTVQIIVIKNPDILAEMQRREIDAAWVPEPWATRLIHDAGARLVVDERDLWPNRKLVTTVVVVRREFLEKHAGIVDAVLAAHVRTTEWLKANSVEGRTIVNAELKRLTGKALPAAVIDEAWTRVSFGPELDAGILQEMARSAAEAGYLKQGVPQVAPMIDGAPLSRARALAR